MFWIERLNQYLELYKCFVRVIFTLIIEVIPFSLLLLVFNYASSACNWRCKQYKICK